MNNLSFDFWENTKIYKNKLLKNVIIDRKSKYTVLLENVSSKEEIDKFMKKLLLDSYFKKASHNSFAWRIKLENWSVLEWKNDDWETGAGLCILRELQRDSAVNILVILTRYFWWIHLNSDRFKNVINATKKVLEK